MFVNYLTTHQETEMVFEESFFAVETFPNRVTVQGKTSAL